MEKQEWFMNTGLYPFQDSDSGVRFEPGVKVMAPMTKWLAGQPTIKRIEAQGPTSAEVDTEVAKIQIVAPAKVLPKVVPITQKSQVTKPVKA